VSIAALSRHAQQHLPLHLARAESAAAVAAADALAERLNSYERDLSRMFHEAAAAGDWRAATATVREIRALMEVLERVGAELDRPLPAGEEEEWFEWPNGEICDVAPLESPETMAEHQRTVTPRQHIALPAPRPPALLPDGTPRPRPRAAARA